MTMSGVRLMLAGYFWIWVGIYVQRHAVPEYRIPSCCAIFTVAMLCITLAVCLKKKTDD